MTTIEDIILRFDKRGMTPLRPHLPEDYCTRAARCILDAPGRALIGTGFYITRAGATETDGPPGAYFIGKALEALGRPRHLRHRPIHDAPLRGLRGAGGHRRLPHHGR